jgi:hypothetical protein
MSYYLAAGLEGEEVGLPKDRDVPRHLETSLARRNDTAFHE